jgi:nucleotide-binding universal stress UspA family protein
MSAHALAPVRQPYVVVVGIDSSRACEAAVDWVVPRAYERGHWRMHLVHVTTLAPAGWSDEDALRRLRAVRADFERILPKLRPFDETSLLERVTFHQACAPDPSVALVRFAAEVDADLIVIGSEPGVLPSRGVPTVAASSDRIARHAGCPVMIARPKGHIRRPVAVH